MHKDSGSQASLSLHLLNFFVYGIASIFTSYLQIYYMSAGLDKLQIGELLAAGPLVSVAAHAFWNYCRSRQLSTRNTLILLLIGILLSVQLLLWVETYRWIVWGSLILFFFLSPLLTMNHTFTLEKLGESSRELKQSYPASRLWASLGWAILPFSLSYTLNDGIFHRLPIIILVTLFAAAAIVFGLSFPSVRQLDPTPPLTGRQITGVLLNKYFMAFLLLGMLITIPFAVNQLFMPLFMTDLGGSVLDVSLAIFAATILEAVIFYGLARWIKRQMSRLLLVLTAVSLLSTLRWNLMAGATLPVHVILIGLLNAATLGGFFLVGTRLTSLFLPKPFRSAGQTLCVLCWSGMSAVIAGLMGGWLFQNFGSVILYKTLVSMALCGTIGLGLLWAYIHRNGYAPSKYYS
ncbi:MFS transporter [Paenibacillus yonginensis]|uniref:MFS transporter n=1 Tax=Paenibacillus yonginensis TaxID=1462996 RepID=UPI001F3170D4|nr:MFS transporter [Paenibacillus yonginensis]